MFTPPALPGPEPGEVLHGQGQIKSQKTLHGLWGYLFARERPRSKLPDLRRTAQSAPKNQNLKSSIKPAEKPLNAKPTRTGLY